jgi:hypothetical protein
MLPRLVIGFKVIRPILLNHMLDQDLLSEDTTDFNSLYRSALMFSQMLLQ